MDVDERRDVSEDEGMWELASAINVSWLACLLLEWIAE